jgi:hypothetical protein
MYGSKKLSVNHGLIPASRHRLIEVAIIAQVSNNELAIIRIEPMITPTMPVSVNTKNTNVTMARISQVDK